MILKLGPPSSASAAAMSTGAAKAAYVRRVREDQFAVDGRALRLFVSNVRFPNKLHVRLGSRSACRLKCASDLRFDDGQDSSPLLHFSDLSGDQRRIIDRMFNP